jgi:predicted MFS family arabinose efflux permease
MAGLLIGILGARTLAGTVAEWFGWREMFWLATGLMIMLGLVLSRFLPNTKPTSDLSYPALLGSLWTLFRREPVLREAASVGALLFAAFSAFWATLTLLLAGPDFRMGPQVAGLFGLVGVAGALVAPLAGRLADHGGPRRTIGLSIAAVLAGFVCFALSARSLIGLGLGVLLLDIGVQAALISNQSRIYALGAESRSLGALAWSLGGWLAVSGLGIAAMLAASFIHWRGR